MNSIALLLTAGIVFSLQQARAERPRAVFTQKTAINAVCLPRPANARQIVERYNVKMVRWGANEETIPRLGAILQEVERVHGKAFFPFGRLAVDVDPALDILGRQVYDPNLRMPKVLIADDQNVALLAHEMGHVIGNTGKPGGGTWYQAYNAFNPTPCHATEYSESGYQNGRRNEEFAEMFSGYVTTPYLLKDGDSSCRRAYAFFRTVLFPAADTRCLVRPSELPARPPLPRPRPFEAPRAPVYVLPVGVPGSASAPKSPAPAAKPSLTAPVLLKPSQGFPSAAR